MMTAEQAKARSDAFVSDTGTASKVQQHFRDEVDVNTIVRRFGLTGEVPAGAPAGIYADLRGIESLEDAVQLVDSVRERFSALPAEVRDRFRNDPVTFAQAVQSLDDEELVRETSAAVPPVPPVPPVAPAAPPAV